MLESNKDKGVLDINCCDPLGRSALLMAIDNENLEIIELLLDNKVRMVLLGTGQIGKKILICLDGKTMTPHYQGKTFLFCSSKQFPHLHL